MHRKALVKRRARGHALPEVMIASVLGVGIVLLAFHGLYMLRMLTLQLSQRDAAREQAEWVLGHLSAQLRDASVDSGTSPMAVVQPIAMAGGLFQLAGRAGIDCLGRLSAPTQMTKNYYLVAKDGLYDLRCSQTGAGDGVWTLASGIPLLGIVVAVDSDADGVSDRHVPPAKLIAADKQLRATLSIALWPITFKTGFAKREARVVAQPQWWDSAYSQQSRDPADFEWLATTVALTR
jgi:hypothetical protein